MRKPYSYIRYRWLRPVDFEGLLSQVEGLRVEHRPLPSSRFDVSPYKDERDGYKLSADTLHVFLYPFRAVLFQTSPGAFTVDDLRLREAVLRHYPSERGTILTMAAISEPPFEVA